MRYHDGVPTQEIHPMKITDQELIQAIWFNQLRKIVDACASLNTERQCLIANPDSLKRDKSILDQSLQLNKKAKIAKNT